MNGFLLTKVGVLATIQDAGRVGHAAIGLTTGGPLDSVSWAWANRLVGHEGQAKPSAAAIECMLGGVAFETMVPTRIAVTGAPAMLRINDELQPLWQTHCLVPGDRVSLDIPAHGLCSYIAFGSGIQSPLVLGSRSTVVREGIGGLRDNMTGAALRAGDFVPIEPDPIQDRWRLPESGWPTQQTDAPIRVIPASQSRLFSRVAKRRLFSSRFTVDHRSDRMGFRLSGHTIDAPQTTMRSEPLAIGAIQITPDGTPIIMLADRQTMGGYPKIGTVIGADIHRFGQLRPGDSVRFCPVTVSTARRALSALLALSATELQPLDAARR